MLRAEAGPLPDQIVMGRRVLITIPIVVDFIHVLEYLWSGCWCFFPEGDPAAERWVSDKARQVLDGRAEIVAAAIRRKATTLGLDANQRNNADRCADYLLAKRPYLDYPTALKNGWPIATGVIEGACRHLVKDRMDITGARWGLAGAEAILTLRALISNGRLRQLLGLPPRPRTPPRSRVTLRPRRHPRTRISPSKGPAPLWKSAKELAEPPAAAACKAAFAG